MINSTAIVMYIIYILRSSKYNDVWQACWAIWLSIVYCCQLQNKQVLTSFFVKFQCLLLFFLNFITTEIQVLTKVSTISLTGTNDKLILTKSGLHRESLWHVQAGDHRTSSFPVMWPNPYSTTGTLELKPVHMSFGNLSTDSKTYSPLCIGFNMVCHDIQTFIKQRG